jgi:hypothetical protein
MSIELNVPQSSVSPQIASFSRLIPLTDIPANTNQLPVTLAGAKFVSVDNRSLAGIMVQVIPQSMKTLAPFIEFIDPGKKQVISFGVPLDTLILSNMSSTLIGPSALPPPALNFFIPGPVAEQNLTTGFVLVSATSGELSIQSDDNDAAAGAVQYYGSAFNITRGPGTWGYQVTEGGKPPPTVTGWDVWNFDATHTMGLGFQGGDQSGFSSTVRQPAGAFDGAFPYIPIPPNFFYSIDIVGTDSAVLSLPVAMAFGIIPRGY